MVILCGMIETRQHCVSKKIKLRPVVVSKVWSDIDFLPQRASRGLISNDLKQIGRKTKGTPTHSVSAVSLIVMASSIGVDRCKVQILMFFFLQNLEENNKPGRLLDYLKVITPVENYCNLMMISPVMRINLLISGPIFFSCPLS